MTGVIPIRPHREASPGLQALEGTLVDLGDLSFQVEQALITLKGPGAERVDLLLRQLAEQDFAWLGTLAESLSAVDTQYSLHVSALAAKTPLRLLPAGNMRDHEVISFFDESIERLMDRLRERLETLPTADGESRGLLASLLDWLDDQAATLRAHVAHRQPPKLDDVPDSEDVTAA